MKPAIEITLSPEMIERVLSVWEEEHPGQDAMRDLSSDEFADRMMAEIIASARRVPR